MAPVIVNHNSGARQSPLSDISSISSSLSLKSSRVDNLNQFMDKMLKVDASAASREGLDDFRQQQLKTGLEADSASYSERNWTHESNKGCDEGKATRVDVEEEKEAIVVMPLKQWNDDEARKSRHCDFNCQRNLQQVATIRKITVAFGIGKLLQHVAHHDSTISNYSWSQLRSMCSVDNFAVEFKNEGVLSESRWEVRRVYMINPFMSVQIDTILLSSNYYSFDNENNDGLNGRNVVATITCPFPSLCVNTMAEETSDCDRKLCHLLGVLLHFLFSENRSEQMKENGLLKEGADYEPSSSKAVEVDGPSTKKKSLDWFQFDTQCSLSHEPVDAGEDLYPLVREEEFSQAVSDVEHEDLPNHVGNIGRSRVNLPLSPLINFGYPPSLSQLVANLVDCGLGLFRVDAYTSLHEAVTDMQILLREPMLFLSMSPPSTIDAFMGSGKLYGRSNETASLTNAYNRVASSGKSEAIFVGGFSGIFESVNIAGGYAVTQKFDQMQSSSPLSVVLSALNQLCFLVAQTTSETCLMDIYVKLSRAIGLTNLAFLTSILPNASELVPSHVTLPYLNSQYGINFNSLCFTIQHLMRVISSPLRTVLLFLDDLQWADAMSLKLVQCILCDVKGLNCLLFVGGVRENEVEQGHVLLEFFDALSSSDVISSRICLNGISPNDVNSMISDTLGVFPRLCKGLSDVVFRKTNGNPFFTLEFLRSLITRDIVQYSLRDKCWKWNLAHISAENIADNVLHLLTRKINVLSESNQTALKVASCFRSVISVDVVRKLSSTSQYSSLQKTLDETLVKEGFMDCDGTRYRFVHDKVREAAYGLIFDKEQYHFDLGMALQIVGGDIFAAVNQINRGPLSLLQDDSRRILIVNLNYEASIHPMDCSDFTTAYSYLNAAVSVLPNESWTAHYDLTLKCYFRLAKAAYSCGRATRAQHLCDEIIKHGKCLEDTLETYSLLVSMICLARQDLLMAFKTCIKVLNLLGEDIPDNVVDTNSTVKKAKLLFQDRSSEDLLAMVDETSSRSIAIMEFYNHLVTVSFHVKQRHICLYYNARWASFCLTHGVACKYTSGAFVSFASILSRDLDEDARLACRISKTGMIMLSRNNSAIQQLPGVYAMHYMMVGSLTEPIQSAAAMSHYAYEIGMQTGNLSQAAFCLAIMMARSLYAGTNLLNLKSDLQVHLNSAKQHSQLILFANLVMMHEVVSKLIGDEEAESFQYLEEFPSTDDDFQLTLEIFSSFYLGHTERVHYKSKLWDRLEDSEKRKVPIRFIYTAFFSGIASFRLFSCGRKGSQTHTKNLAKSLSILERASGFSAWNYENKYLLLKAAHLSITDQNFNPENEFGAAILASQASKFVHEEGLACELAALHHLKHDNKALALTLFRQAKSCYKMWGSQVKKNHIASLIEAIQE
ncbi:hypothetical protein ACHAWX_003883 [Stephanocyclus meneghinianus]